ncbi:hypothetical protein [Sphingomonas pruni]|uniref:hypothetical protein n=1 Tax=Sphingomonas pruni TaxID=40683 RepID=UPI0012EE1D79|nr:hypothetical protein [Sphingomonas pruni]
MKRWLVFAMVAPLAACNPFANNDGPSEKDISDALARSGAKVQSAERIACKTAPDRPGYVCDYRATTCSPFTGKCDKSATRTGRFVRYGDNWMFRDDVADPNRYATPVPAPAPSPAMIEPSPVPTPSPTASPTPEPTPSSSPSPKPSPTPTASPTPKPSPTAKPSPKPSPTPKPTPTAKPSPKPTPGGVNRTWLSGRWGAEDGDCTARRAVNFGPGGGFYGKRGMGRWSLDGKTVKVTGNYSADNKPFDQVLKVERIGDDALVMEGKRYHRCPN